MTQPYTSTHIVHVTDTTDRNAYLKIRGAYSKHAGAFGLRDSFVDAFPRKTRWISAWSPPNRCTTPNAPTAC